MQASPQDQPDTHFGYRTVPLDEKQTLVDEVFHKVARRYDIMNDFMSGGLHRAWKDAMVSKVRPPQGARAFRLLDLAGGTGDVSFRVVGAGGAGTQAVVADINREMLAVGRERAEKRGLSDKVEFVDANAESLPFADASFDAVTIAFGIRNVPRIPLALSEMKRVLKPGGRALVLEFSRVDVPLLDKIYDFYSFRVIPELGRRVAGEAEPYQYLVESIRRFPPPATFAQMMREAGFGRVDFTLMTGGVVALHSGFRI
ncbi:MAG: bifunctional demethylmenaquinone methyltransferase/2-methoxy-6-polyprenyl-1,4-benzoquinol methylase [Rhizobiales bacterium 24-66-13]|jgi:demethylmenaquinone methyltransferase/2-methoxy-6-polyprenyl-1,4-benzoquinol methylase|nr:MAG: bifunctional demethylmenaquinone methyltransferase/2-methoxy-6-polyprenyl-1,4-benzoquinol methylase [Rhizobiales bacterium 24-66-13]OZB04170.1 MAG: bifunctional demethylmenaquinone methyltransferase/2-methoxy-6-polyprenyl-1,4-benzoquinol methylase [Rhizobiales bacterium 39-66-18]HQS09711.1 bifunctional demethylmenaquinone methyltransferase/2-methoxy-6-polyprenyl-1,4-benzoquinol methylase UbiE [Xanthobacteraceae bacterium]HQS46123.1 bifunctional demethylmenaquinone methyltransferase/2-met